MQNDYINIVLELVKVITAPNISQYAREKTIKELVCRSVDIHPDFGSKTKRELKDIINAANNEQGILDVVFAYMSTHNCYE